MADAVTEEQMATITLKGNPIHSAGELPALGSKAPDFSLTKGDLSEASLADFSGKVCILNISPSLDTGTCASVSRNFNTKIKALGGVVVLTVSRDLPFAQKRFCEAEGIDTVITLSELRNHDFGKSYGVELVDGPLAGLLARSVVVIDIQGKVVYTEQVQEISKEPNYDAALAAAKVAAAGY